MSERVPDSLVSLFPSADRFMSFRPSGPCCMLVSCK